MASSYRNPFGTVNAVQLDDAEILKFWCSPFTYQLFDEVSEHDILGDPTHIVIKGGRSTGKTMFLRYWSFPVQLELAKRVLQANGKGIVDTFVENGGIAVYIRIDGLVLRSFSGSGINVEDWNAIFVRYLELTIGRLLVQAFKELGDAGALNRDEVNRAFIPAVAGLFDSTDTTSFDGLIGLFDMALKEIDDYRGHVPFYRNGFTPTISIPARKFVFGIPEIAARELSQIPDDFKFALLIDEYENFTEHQQRVVNTMLRTSKRSILLRLGMRLEGFRTTDTISSDDFVKEGRDYRTVLIEEFLSKSQDYNNYLIEICRKRLSSVPEFADRNQTDIVGFLGEKEDFEQEARQLVNDDSEKLFRHFRDQLAGIPTDDIRCPGKPLLELLNIIWVIRGNTPEHTKECMEGFLGSERTDPGVKKYRLDYTDKYKLSLLFLLNAIYRKHKKYYSFNTFAFLSSGIVGNFIALCHKAFQFAEFEERESLVETGRISTAQQHRAAIHVSQIELKELVRIEDHGNRIYTFVKNLGNVFREFHRDTKIKYPETNQFSADTSHVSGSGHNAAFRAAIKWSAIQQKSRLQSPKPGKRLSEIYTINRIFSPAFEITFRTRGGYSVELSSQMLGRMMDESDFDPKQLVPQREIPENDDQLKLDW